MGSQRQTLFFLLQILVVITGAQACHEPPKGVFFTREDLKGDIVMTILPKGAEVDSDWSVKGVLGVQSESRYLAKNFGMFQDGPLWNLVVTKPIRIPRSDSEKAHVLKINLDIECTDKLKKSTSHTVRVHVFPKEVLEKILITVPENTPTQQFIYHDKEKASYPPATYKHHPLPETIDASEFLSLNNATGSVMLVKALDYERDSTVMWYLTIKIWHTPRSNKLRLFRIEIGNVNDNAPEFYASAECQEEIRCKVVSYAFTMDSTGKLESEVHGNSIYAVDPDGDGIAYSIVQAMPQQDFIQIDKRTGELITKRPPPDAASRYVLTVKASDGYHSNDVSVVVEIEKDAGEKALDAILELLDMNIEPSLTDGVSDTTYNEVEEHGEIREENKMTKPRKEMKNEFPKIYNQRKGDRDGDNNARGSDTTYEEEIISQQFATTTLPTTLQRKAEKEKEDHKGDYSKTNIVPKDGDIIPLNSDVSEVDNVDDDDSIGSDISLTNEAPWMKVLLRMSKLRGLGLGKDKLDENATSIGNLSARNDVERDRNATTWTGQNSNITNLQISDAELLYLLDLCGNLSLILQETRERQIGNESIWSNSSTANSDSNSSSGLSGGKGRRRNSRGTVSDTDGDNEDDGVALKSELESNFNDSIGGTNYSNGDIGAAAWTELYGIALRDRNGSFISLEEANRTCVAVMEDEDFPELGVLRKSTAVNIVGNLFALVVCTFCAYILTKGFDLSLT